MIANEEKSYAEKEQRGTVLDCDTKPEIGTREAPGDRAAGGQGQMGFVYFIETDDRRFIKIGYTASLLSRVAQIEATLRPEPIRLLGYIPGTCQTEAFFHNRFASHRERGEWFRYVPEISILIESIGLIERPSGKAFIPKRHILNSVAPAIKPNPTASDMGKVGGPARAASLTPERRKEIARLGGLARAASLKSKNGMEPKRKKNCE